MGDDILQGDCGDDLLDRGDGNDTYYYIRGDGNDRIADSGSGDDVVLCLGFDASDSIRVNFDAVTGKPVQLLIVENYVNGAGVAVRSEATVMLSGIEQVKCGI